MESSPTENSANSRFSTPGNGRLRFISYLQIIGIILVVLGHSMHEYPGLKDGKLPTGFFMMYSFRMPLFMFVSGFLMIFTTHFRNRVRSVGEFVRGKVLRLLLPFAVLTIVTFVPRSFMSDVADDSIDLSLGSFFLSFIKSDSLVIPFFWFIQASFILLVFNYAVLGIGKKIGIDYRKVTFFLMLLFLLISLLPSPGFYKLFSIGRVMDYGLYFTAGMACCSYSDRIDSIVPWTSGVFLIVSIVAWIGFFFMPLPILCSFAGIAMCMSVAKILARNERCFLDHLVGANYLIFLLSWYCNVLTQQVLRHYVELPWWIYSILSLTTGIYIPWLVYRYLMAHPQSRWVRLTAFLLGQNLNKSKVSTK